jgi:ankyrin repeat protein
MLQQSAATFVAKRSCVSCHHNALSILTLRLAHDRGFGIDQDIVRTVEEKTFRELSGPTALDEAVQGVRVSDPTPNDSLLLMAARASGIEPSLTTAVYARRILGWQRDGHWVTSDFRPPHSSSLFAATATAVRAIREYLPDQMRAEGAAALQRARQWLLAHRPLSAEDAAFRLMGLAWAGVAPETLVLQARDLLALQAPTGGWSQLSGGALDAYSTGEVLFALHEAGVSTDDRSWRRGLRFLLSTQAQDGTWHVRSRMISPAVVSPPFFEVGFPYEKDQFLSYAGSCWAVMALLTDLPGVLPDPRPYQMIAQGGTLGFAHVPAGEVAPWVRTVLLGTATELAQSLEAGLDPNSRTAGGTTLLMMAAPDPEKVAVLLAHGANARQRTESGVDAMTIAASYRGTALSLALLLTRGGEAEPSATISAKHSPLLFASMTGDVRNITLLLAHGADPDGASTAGDTPMSSAVTFGYADVVSLLVSTRAKVSMTEATGINLLHWATIANRASVIPVLAKAGVPINARDENGFTPIMYAATIDFGDEETIRALINAGADASLRNDEGRTALQQARHHKHTRLEAALR